MCVRALPCSVCDANLTKRCLDSACEFHQPAAQVVDTYGGTIAEQALLALKDGGISLSYSRQPEPYSKERAKGKAYTSAFASRASQHTRSTHMHAHALPTPARGSCSAHGKALCTAPVYAGLGWTLLRVLLDYHRVMWSTHPSVLDDSAVLPLTADRTLLPALCRSLCTPCLFRPCGTCGSTDRRTALTPP